MPKFKTDNIYIPCKDVQLVKSGTAYFTKLLELINHASNSIHIQAYIYEDDETGTLIAEALKAAAGRMVKVWLMADGYASQQLSKSFVTGLKEAGIQFRFFEPVIKSRYFYFGRRMHHKIAVADGEYAIVGGINISNNYNDLPGKPAWLDFALYVEGATAASLQTICQKTWNGFAPLKEKPPLADPITPTIPTGDGAIKVKISRNDWVRRKNDISRTYIEMLLHATSDVTILSSYFLPGNAIRTQMRNAIKRGVKVRVIATGTTDVPISKAAERWLYDWLLRAGVELFEYQGNVLHGKLGVSDNEWMTIGSYNLNNISAYASIELNLNVRNGEFVKTVRQTLDEIITNHCLPITTGQQNKTKNIFSRLNRWVSYQLVRLLIYLFTFYFKHQP